MQRTQRIYAISEFTHFTNLRNYGRNAMTSLLDRQITAASDDGVCRWHAAKLWQTREIIEIKFDLHKLHDK